VANARAWRHLVCVALVLAGCGSAGPGQGRPLPVYEDAMEYHVRTSRGLRSRAEAATEGQTYYFQVNSPRICYGFQVPGTWEAGREPGVLRRIDGRGLVGVLLLSVRELGARSPDEALRRAAERSRELSAPERGGKPWTLEPYPRVPGAWHWTLPLDPGPLEPPGKVNVIPRWYVPAGADWIAQFSIGIPPGIDSDGFVTAVLTSLTTSREPRCYEARLRELGVVR
jgi:hypothetical protein